MSEKIITARIKKNGEVVQVHPDGTETPMPDQPMRPMTEEEIEAAAWSDPDNLPVTDGDIASGRVKRIPRVKTLRRALGMTQEEFARAFHLSIATLRDWEQGRCEPDQATRAYLKVIAVNPQNVMDALAYTPPMPR